MRKSSDFNATAVVLMVCMVLLIMFLTPGCASSEQSYYDAAALECDARGYPNGHPDHPACVTYYVGLYETPAKRLTPVRLTE